MEYEKENFFTGDTGKAIEAARSTFLPNWFEIVGSDGSMLEVVNRNTILGNNQHPLNGISRACISVSDGKIVLRAELGNVKRMMRFSLFLWRYSFWFCLVFFSVWDKGSLWARWF